MKGDSKTKVNKLAPAPAQTIHGKSPFTLPPMWRMGPYNIDFFYNRAMFHFHDGWKGKTWQSVFFFGSDSCLEDFILCMSHLLIRSALCQIQRFDLPHMRIILATLLKLLTKHEPSANVKYFSSQLLQDVLTVTSLRLVQKKKISNII